MDILDMKSKTTKSETSLTIKIEDIWNSAMQQTMLYFSYSVDCYECTINRLSHQNNCRNRNVVPSFHYTIGSNVSDNNTPFAKIFKTFLKRSIFTFLNQTNLIFTTFRPEEYIEISQYFQWSTFLYWFKQKVIKNKAVLRFSLKWLSQYFENWTHN